MIKVAWSEIYNHPLPEGHRFPMRKYDLLPERLVWEGTIKSSDLFSPRVLSEEEILAVHDRNYWERLRDLKLSEKEIRRSGFPLSRELVQREITINGGTIQCAEFALDYGVALNIAGGTHHAYSDHAEGFCLLNDIAIAAQYLLAHKKASQILVVDLDVHQGNGTAEIFRNNEKVFTFSMHGADNYPLHKEKSNLDIPLENGTNDATYLQLLDIHLRKLLETIKPDFIFFQSGVDVLATDKLGKLGLSIMGCQQRDELVFSTCKNNKIPVTVSMGGGYSENIEDIIEAHANTFRVACAVYP